MTIVTSLALLSSCDKGQAKKEAELKAVDPPKMGVLDDPEDGGASPDAYNGYLIVPQAIENFRECPEDRVFYEGKCCTREELAEEVEESDNQALADVQSTDFEKKAKGSARLIRNQERSVGLAEDKLDEILEDLKAEEKAREAEEEGE